MRRALGVAAALAAAVFGALVLMEHELVGFAALVSAALYGVGLAEAGLLGAGRRDAPPWLGWVVAALAAAGWTWAVEVQWRFAPSVPASVRAAALVAGVAGLLWLRGAQRPGAGTPPTP